MHRLAPALVAAGLAVLAAAPSAFAAPPPNDSSALPAAFTPYASNNGVPTELSATAELAEATSDPEALSCLGPGSFARSVWYRIDGAPGAREHAVEAVGRTLALADLAAYVQTTPGGPFDLRTPNRCSGADAGGGADAAEDRTSGLTIRVPPGHAVLLQVGRRGPVAAPDDERVELSLRTTVVPRQGPVGDRAGRATPLMPKSGVERLGLSGATTTAEDPSTPVCASAGSVWRRIRPRRSRPHVLTVHGAHAGSLSLFRGARPTRDTLIDCVDREGGGPLRLRFRARARRKLWVRVGTDRPPVGARGRLVLGLAGRGASSSGGGCLPSQDPVLSARAATATRLRQANRSRAVGLAFRVRRGPVCRAELRLVGPRNRIYARADVAAIRGGGEVVFLRRTRRLVRGSYRLRVEARGLVGVRMAVRTRTRLRIR